MGGIFKIVDKDGKVSFSDSPQDDVGGKVSSWRPGNVASSEPGAPPKTKQEKDYESAQAYIAQVRKRVPNLYQYLVYIEDLRASNPIRWDAVVRKLQQEDPEIWLKLQKFPQFQPLTRALNTPGALENRWGLVANFIGRNYVGGLEKFAEASIKDLTARQSIPADTLAAKASTLSRPPVREYSNSKLGQFMAREVPREEAAATAAAKDLAKGREAIRGGAATSFGRFGGSMIDLELALLHPDRGHEWGSHRVAVANRQDGRQRYADGRRRDAAAPSFAGQIHRAEEVSRRREGCVFEGGSMMRRLLLGFAMSALVPWQACTAAPAPVRPVAVDRCPEVAATPELDPFDPPSIARNWKNAPRIAKALGSDRHDLLRNLLAAGENPNICLLGFSVLELSTGSGDVEEVRILLDGGAHPDLPLDANGGTPLMMALQSARFGVARLLIARGANVRAVGDGNRTAIYQLTSALLSSASRAEQAEQAAIARELLDAGAAVDVPLGVPHMTPLMLAASRGNKPMVELMLARSADPRRTDFKGRTPRDFALAKGHAEVAELLSAAQSSMASAPLSR